MLPVARQLGLHVLVEVHTADILGALLDAIGPPGREPGREPEREPGREQACEPDCEYVLGINNRDLSAQRTDLAVTERLASMLPAGTPFVTESGLATREDVTRVTRAGARAMLVGESLLKADDMAGKIAALLGRGDPH